MPFQHSQLWMQMANSPKEEGRSLSEPLLRHIVLSTRGGEITACSCLIYPFHNAGYVVRLTAIHFPPSADAILRMVGYLTEPDNQASGADGEAASHLLGGDFNQYAWKGKSDDLFQERYSEQAEFLH